MSDFGSWYSPESEQVEFGKLYEESRPATPRETAGMPKQAGGAYHAMKTDEMGGKAPAIVFVRQGTVPKGKQVKRFSRNVGGESITKGLPSALKGPKVKGGYSPWFEGKQPNSAALKRGDKFVDQEGINNLGRLMRKDPEAAYIRSRVQANRVGQGVAASGGKPYKFDILNLRRNKKRTLKSLQRKRSK